MSKIRTVKPEFFRHERLFEAELSSRLPLRLIFIGLFTVVDAKGRFRWRPRQLKLDIVPYDQIDFTAALAALADYGFIERYEYGGEYYGYIPTWHKHQSINQREPDSVLPDPQQGLIFKPPSAHVMADRLSRQDPHQTRPVTAMHRPASASLTASTNHDLAASFPLMEIHTTSDASSVSIPEPETPVTASSTVADPRTCMHVQDAAAQMQHHAPPVPSMAENRRASLEMEMEVEKEKELEGEEELEMEGKGKWKNRQPPHPRAVPDPVVSVFEHWRQVMDHPKAILDKQRRRTIRLALDRGYREEDLCLAITGCSLTPHNCGHNDRGERYDGLHLILRSADQIDRFIRNAQYPPKPLNPAEQRLHSNVQAAQDWLQGQQEVSGESY